jgi:hypothetical protein
MCSQLYKIINVVDLLFKRMEIEQLLEKTYPISNQLSTIKCNITKEEKKTFRLLTEGA